MKNMREFVSPFSRWEKPDASISSHSSIPSPFVVGVGRSGTTLLRLMLDAHPELAIPPETQFIPAAVAAVNEQSSDPHAAFLKALMSDQVWKDHCLDESLLEQRIYEIRPFDLSEALRTFYRLYTEKFQKPRWGDKTPRYLLHMRQIHSLLPEARFIHLIRDGRDVALSLVGVWFGPKTIEEAAHWWKSWIQQARTQATDLPHYLEIRYEDLVLNTSSSLKTISTFIDLPWDNSMLDYHLTAEQRMKEKDRDILTADSKLIPAGDRIAIHSYTRQPPQAHRINRWKTEMSASDRAIFENVAGDELREFGYEVS